MDLSVFYSCRAVVDRSRKSPYEVSGGCRRSTEESMSVFRKARVIVPAMILVLVSVSLSAQSTAPRRMFGANKGDNYVGRTLQLLLAQHGRKRLGSLTGAEIRKALDVVSVARQQQAYVRRSETASLFMPGAGQFINNAPVAGSLYLAGHLAVAAGTLVGAYFLLPSDLQFGSTNYFTDSFTTINNRWRGHSLLDYLPSAAVMAGGMILDHVIRHFSAENAEALARKNIKEKKVTFRPEPFFVLPGPRGPMMGFGWKMRF